jgi:hypothetical protein
MAWTFNGKIIREGRSWTGAKGIKHPTGWGRWSEVEKLAAGLVWQDDPAPYDNRFYWDANTPKALDDVPAVNEEDQPILDDKGEQVITLGLKSVWKNTIKAQAGGLLAASDWYVTRKAETGADIPADVLTYREAVRTASNTIEAAIDAAADHAAFVALFDTPVDDNLEPTGNAPIADWPDEV